MRAWLSIAFVLGCASHRPFGPTTQCATQALDPVTSVFCACTSQPTKPLTAGQVVDSSGIVTLHWPSPWTESTDGASTPYNYVPSGASTAMPAVADIAVWPSYLANETATQYLADTTAWADMLGGYSEQIDVAGHPSVVWWAFEPPANPGCVGCPPDPGPDYITLFLVIDVGRAGSDGLPEIVNVAGGARSDAQPAPIFCDIDAIVRGVTFAM